MINRKHYLIQLIESSGKEYWLRKDTKAFHWHNHGKDKEYKSLAAAIKRAVRIHNRLRDNNSTIHVVEVTFKPCTPELQDGFYKPVKRAVFTR